MKFLPSQMTLLVCLVVHQAWVHGTSKASSAACLLTGAFCSNDPPCSGGSDLEADGVYLFVCLFSFSQCWFDVIRKSGRERKSFSISSADTH